MRPDLPIPQAEQPGESEAQVTLDEVMPELLKKIGQQELDLAATRVLLSKRDKTIQELREALAVVRRRSEHGDTE